MLINLNNPRSAGPVSEQDLDARLAEQFIQPEAAHAATELQADSDAPLQPMTPLEKALLTLIYATSAAAAIALLAFAFR